MLASFPASMVNHDSTAMGISARFYLIETRSSADIRPPLRINWRNRALAECRHALSKPEKELQQLSMTFGTETPLPPSSALYSRRFYYPSLPLDCVNAD